MIYRPNANGSKKRFRNADQDETPGEDGKRNSTGDGGYKRRRTGDNDESGKNQDSFK